MKRQYPKLRTEGGKWYVDEGYKTTACDTSTEAWRYIFILKEIRQKAPQVPRSLYPVRSLNPLKVIRGCKRYAIQN